MSTVVCDIICIFFKTLTLYMFLLIVPLPKRLYAHSSFYPTLFGNYTNLRLTWIFVFSRVACTFLQIYQINMHVPFVKVYFLHSFLISFFVDDMGGR